MGYIKDLSSHPDPQTFPAAKFEAVGEIPAAQCSEAKIESTAGSTINMPFLRLLESGKFTGYNLVGKVAHIISNPGGNTGNFDITANSNDSCTLTQDPGCGAPTAYYISNGGELIDTQNASSLAAFVSAAGYAYTIKGGRLYTDMPDAQLQNACTILWNPQQ